MLAVSLASGTFAGVGVVGTSVLAPSPAAADPAPTPATFSKTTTGAYNGTVPDGVCAVNVEVRGGAGGNAIGASGVFIPNGNGAGADLRVTYPVSPGQSFSGVVGGGGVAPAGTAGSNGGGDAGTARTHAGAGGGGWSNLLIGGSELVVAGGGGGAGGGHNTQAGRGGDGGIPAGGASGTYAGTDGRAGNQSGGVNNPGRGGTGSAAGAGGVNAGDAGRNGSAGNGRNGGDGGPEASADSGGGGGGGLFGGGGGSSTINDGSGVPTATGIGAAGGGGGSSRISGDSPTGHGAASAISGANGPRATSTTQAVSGADGLVTLTWVTCDYDLAVTKTASPATATPGQTVTWTVSVTNNGDSPMTRGDTVTVTDTLPGPGTKTITGITTTGGSNDIGLARGNVTCDAATGAAMPGTLTCTRPYASDAPTAANGGNRGLDPGETLTVTYDQVIPAGAADATYNNQVTVNDRGPAGNNTATTQLRVASNGPTATDDTASTPFNTPVTLPGATNDTSGDSPINPALTVFTSPNATNGGKTLVTAQGTFRIAADGSVTFTPANGYSGTTPPVEYRVTDGNGKTDTANLTVTVRPGPTATPDTRTTRQGAPVTLNPFTNDTPGPNANNSAGTFTPGSVKLTATGLPAGSTVAADGKSATVPGQGTYTVGDDGQVTFTPLPAFTGTASPIRYTVTDNNGNTTGSTITITVTPVTPGATDDTANTPFNTPVTLPAATNDTAGDPDVPIVVSQTVFTTAGQPAGSTVSADGKTLTTPQGVWKINADGTSLFTPAAGYSGTTPAVRYQVTDANGTTATATLQVTVRPGPTATPDRARTPQNTNVTVNPLTNDTPGQNANGTAGTLDPTSVVLSVPAGAPAGSQVSADGKTLTIPGEGVYTVDPDTGQVTFDPEPGFTGAATPAPYTVTDSLGNTASSTITITVDPIRPVATSDARRTPLNTPVTLPAGANDTPGADSAPLDQTKTIFPTDAAANQPAGSTVSADGRTLTIPNVGQYVIDPATGRATFTPADGYVGTTPPVTYQITDVNGTTARATLGVTVERGPLSMPNSATTPQNVNTTLDVLGNDTPGNNADGTPGQFDAGSVTLSVTPNLPAGSTVSADGKTLTVPGEGIYTVAGDGQVTFDPEPQFTGNASKVTYTVNSTVRDEDGNVITQTSSSTIGVAVTPIQPTATDDTANTPFNTPVTLPASANDNPGADSAPIDNTLTVFTEAGKPAGSTISDGGKTLTVPGEGVWTIDPTTGRATFTPEPGYTGTTSPAPYQVTDANGTTDTATLRVTVRNGPTNNADSRTTPQNVNVTVNPLGNDTPANNADGTPGAFDPASVVLTDADPGSNGKVKTVPGVGVYTVNPDGTVLFDPEPTFTGPAPSVEYTVDSLVTDAAGNTVRIPSSSTIDITVSPINPTATNDTGSTPLNTPVTLPGATNDTGGADSAPIDPASVVFPTAGQPTGATVSPDGKTLTVPGTGVYTVNPDGTITFTPEDGFTGDADPVTYQVADTNGTTTTATVGVTVQPGPQGTADPATTAQNVNVDISPLANDTPGRNADGTLGQLDPTSVRFPADGQPAGATVSADGQTLTVPGEGVYTVNPNTGVVTFDPEPQFRGTTTPITYGAQDTVTDAEGNTVHNPYTSTITVDVAAINPVATDDARSTPYNTPVTLPGATNDRPGADSAPLQPALTVFPTDGQPAGSTVSPDGKTLTVPGQGVWAINPDGSATFTPENGFSGPADPVTYQVTDVNGTTDTATLTVTVQAGPSADTDNTNTPQNVNVDLDPLANDTPGTNADGTPGTFDKTSVVFPVDDQPAGSTVSPDGKTLTVPGEGVYTIDPDTGVVTFDPEPQFRGTTTPVAYTARDTVIDADGNTVHNPVGSTLTITVDAIDPVPSPDAKNTTFNTPVTLNVVANDKGGATSAPIDEDSVVFPTAGQPAGATVSPDGKTLTVDAGVFTIGEDGDVTFTPADGFTGPVPTVTYQVSDTNGTTATSTIDITVQGGPEAFPDQTTTDQNTPVTLNPLADNGNGADRAGTNADGTPGTMDPTSVRFPADQPDGPDGPSVVSNDGRTLTVPGEGVYTADPDTGAVTFTPEKQFRGQSTPINYTAQDTVTDADGNTVHNPVTSTIQVSVVGIDPVATDDHGFTPFDTPITASLVGNDLPGKNRAGDSPFPLDPASVVFTQDGQPAGTTVDADGKGATIDGVGRFEIDADGNYTFTPEPGYTGTTPALQYSVADTNGTTATATVDVTVRAAAALSPDAKTTKQNVNVDVDPLANDEPAKNADGTVGTFDKTSVRFLDADQPDGAVVSVNGKTLTVPGEGVYTIDPDTGVVTFDPEPQFTGTASPVSYTVDSVVTDADGNTVRLPSTSTIAITVDAVTPKIADDKATTPFGKPVRIPILANDASGDPSATLDPASVKLTVPAGAPRGTTVSPDGKTLTIPGQGTFTVGDDGVVTFTPAKGFTGKVAQIGYTVADSNGTVQAANIDVTVGPKGVVRPDKATTKPGRPVTVDVLGNDTAPSGLAWNRSSVCLTPNGVCLKTYTKPGVGTWKVNPDGTITFSPAKGYHGTATIPYSVEDTAGNVYTSTLSITVPQVPIARRVADAVLPDTGGPAFAGLLGGLIGVALGLGLVMWARRRRFQ